MGAGKGGGGNRGGRGKTAAEGFPSAPRAWLQLRRSRFCSSSAYWGCGGEAPAMHCLVFCVLQHVLVWDGQELHEWARGGAGRAGGTASREQSL